MEPEGIYRRSAKICMVGSSWPESLVEMNALQPFGSQTIVIMGAQQVFFPSIWNAAKPQDLRHPY